MLDPPEAFAIERRADLDSATFPSVGGFQNMAVTACDLERFIQAQHDSYATALAELQAGRKRSHWMWFIFPQLAGLGGSAMSQQYAIRSLAEARAYFAHPVLGPRLRACISALAPLDKTDVADVLGGIDAIKLRSSLTLFALAVPEERIFAQALERWFRGERDPLTLRMV